MKLIQQNGIRELESGDGWRKVEYDGKTKFVLEFDEVPAFIFVSEDGFRNEAIIKNGEKVEAWTGLNLYSSMEEPTEHEIKYLTLRSKEDEE